MKSKRQDMIDKIIAENEIDTQEALQERLKLAGFDVTQATVSRDIKEMDLVKVLLENNKFKYARSQGATLTNTKQIKKLRSIFFKAVISVDYAQNIVCVKCHSGTGNATCTCIDSMHLGEIVGTIAGDDTIFILLKTLEEAIEFVDKLNEILER